MDDVKFYRCFPTTLGQFSYYPDNVETKDMIDSVAARKKNHGYHTGDDLHTISYFANLREKVLNVNKEYMKDLKFKYDELEITSMWANKLLVGEAHPPHTHSNNFLSGVYYLKAAGETAPIQFFDPRPQANVLRPRNKSNWNNSSMIQFDAVNGTGLVFPSWLQHWVPSTHHERISVSWNVLVRGHYGEPKTFQNAYI